MEFKLNGDLIAVFDEKMAVESLLHGNIVMYLGDPMSMDAKRVPGILGGAILLPNIEAMQALVMGDSQTFIMSYTSQLSNDPNVSDMIDTIIGALYKGSNVVFYAPTDAIDLGFLDVLFEFLENSYGLVVQKDVFHGFEYKRSFTPVYLKALYKYGLISLGEFIAYIPNEYIGDIKIMSLILNYMHIPMTDDNLRYILNWRSKIDSAGVIVNPIIKFA